MKTSEEQWNRWVDEDLSSEQLDALRADSPEIEGEIHLARRISSDLRAHTPASIEPPYPEFFNARILKQIRDERDAIAPTTKAVHSTSPRWPGLLKHGWLIPAAAALMAGVFFGKMLTSPDNAQVAYSYSPESGVHAESLMVGNAVVVKLNGLRSLPAEMDVVWSSDLPLRFNQLDQPGDLPYSPAAFADAGSNSPDLIPVIHMLQNVAPSL